MYFDLAMLPSVPRRIVATGLRFPAPVAFVFLFAAWPWFVEDTAAGMTVWVIPSIVWSLALSLLVETASRLPHWFRFLVPWMAAGLLFPLLELEKHPNNAFFSTFGTLTIVGIFTIIASPWIIGRRSDCSAWLYGLGLAIVLSFAATLFLFAGLGTFSLSVGALFDLKIQFWKVWRPLLTTFPPLCGLALLPPLATIETPRVPSWASILLDWLLAPLTLAYGVLLNVYSIYVVATWSLPRGTISNLTASFTVIGGIIWSAAVVFGPGKISRQTLRVAFVPGLIAPAVAMVVAVSIRVNEYGVTESRYLLWVLAAVIGVLAITQIIRRKIVHPAAAATLLVVVGIVISFGPLSPSSVSARSQMSRLIAALERTERLENGQAIASSTPVPQKDAIIISGAIRHLVTSGYETRVKALFRSPPEVAQNENATTSAETLVKALGVPFVAYNRRDSGRERIHWNANRSEPLIVTGYDYVTTIASLDAIILPEATPRGPLVATFETAQGLLVIKKGKERVAQFDLAAVPLSGSAETNKAPISLSQTIATGVTIRLDIVSLYGWKEEDGRTTLDGFSGVILVKSNGTP